MIFFSGAVNAFGIGAFGIGVIVFCIAFVLVKFGFNIGGYVGPGSCKFSGGTSTSGIGSGIGSGVGSGGTFFDLKNFNFELIYLKNFFK